MVEKEATEEEVEEKVDSVVTKMEYSVGVEVEKQMEYQELLMRCNGHCEVLHIYCKMNATQIHRDNGVITIL